MCVTVSFAGIRWGYQRCRVLSRELLANHLCLFPGVQAPGELGCLPGWRRQEKQEREGAVLNRLRSCSDLSLGMDLDLSWTGMRHARDLRTGDKLSPSAFFHVPSPAPCIQTSSPACLNPNLTSPSPFCCYHPPVALGVAAGSSPGRSSFCSPHDAGHHWQGCASPGSLLRRGVPGWRWRGCNTWPWSTSPGHILEEAA